MPFTSGNIQTRDGTVGGNNGAFENLACAGMTNLTIPDSREIFMGLKNKHCKRTCNLRRLMSIY